VFYSIFLLKIIIYYTSRGRLLKALSLQWAAWDRGYGVTTITTMVYYNTITKLYLESNDVRYYI